MSAVHVNSNARYALRLHPLAVRVTQWINAAIMRARIAVAFFRDVNRGAQWLGLPDLWNRHRAVRMQALSRFVAQPRCDRARFHDPAPQARRPHCPCRELTLTVPHMAEVRFDDW